MKKVIKYSLMLFSIALTLFMFSGCLQNEDLVTENALEGGMVTPTGVIPYKLGATPTVDISIDVPKGPAVSSIEVYNTYYANDTTAKGVDTVLVSNEVLLTTIDVGGANASDVVEKSLSLTYTDLKNDILIKGEALPEDELLLTIGNSWKLTYITVMSDGRKVINNAATTVAVANFFAGPYEKYLKYFHPTAGGTYPTEPYSIVKEDIDLVAISASECTDWFGVWTDTKLIIHINDDNSISLRVIDREDVTQGDPNDPTKVSHYDPATGVIELYYNYSGSGGFRIFWVVYTPK